MIQYGTQQDPAGGGGDNPSSVNRYIYVEDDPVNLVDPSGRFYVQVAYTTYYFGNLPVGVHISSIYIELNSSDLSNIGTIVNVIVGELLNLLPPIPVLSSLLRTYVTNAINSVFGACPNFAALYRNFDTGVSFTFCY